MDHPFALAHPRPSRPGSLMPIQGDSRIAEGPTASQLVIFLVFPRAITSACALVRLGLRCGVLAQGLPPSGRVSVLDLGEVTEGHLLGGPDRRAGEGTLNDHETSRQRREILPIGN